MIANMVVNTYVINTHMFKYGWNICVNMDVDVCENMVVNILVNMVLYMCVYMVLNMCVDTGVNMRVYFLLKTSE